MPQQLWDTTMDPERRFLKRISVEDAAETDRMFRVLMGDQVEFSPSLTATCRDGLQTQASVCSIARAWRTLYHPGGGPQQYPSGSCAI
eukprot:scaffold1839_cov382-Prasinococcus_capsulatus_cf.AAC.10